MAADSEDLQSGAYVPEMDLFHTPSAPTEAGTDRTARASADARAAIVNRTHRVVRERAEAMQARRRNVRDLVVPLVICSVLLVMVCYAVWIVVSNNFGFAPMASSVSTEIEAEASKLMNGQMMDSGGSVYILMMWFLPVSAVTLATILFRRTRGRADDEVTR